MPNLYNINGSFKMLNHAGRVTKWRAGFEPVTADVLLDRIDRSQARIRSLTTAIRDMNALFGRDGVSG